MKRYAKIIITLTIAIFASYAAMAGVEPSKKGTPKKADKDELYSELELLGNAISILRSDYVKEVDSKKLVRGAMKGMLGSLDDFSQFMEPEEYNEIKLETKGEFGGVGIEITMKEGIITIVTPMPGSPAEEAGIKPNDRIIRIDDKITKDMTLADAVKLMRGDSGTKVALALWRESEDRVLEVSLKRAVIKVNSIKKALILGDKIGYIQLVEFQENTPADLDSALKKLKTEGMDSLILDLRNNPGGLLDTSVDVAERFLPKDTLIVTVKSRKSDENIDFKSSGKFYIDGYPLIVMVNEGSASASEIVAGAVKDNKRGMILGMKTFGKASVQAVIPLKDGSALRFTTASYVTPSGKVIRESGIIPDIVVERKDLSGRKRKAKTDIFERVEKPSRQVAPAKEEFANDNQLESAVWLMKSIRTYKGHN